MDSDYHLPQLSVKSFDWFANEWHSGRLPQDYSPVGVLQSSNNLLTRVPDKIKSFTQLEYAFLYNNLFTTIESDAFNAPADAPYPLAGLLSLAANQLTTIEPGAFKGSNFISYFINSEIPSFFDWFLQELKQSETERQYFCTRINWRVSSRPSSSRFWWKLLHFPVDTPTHTSKLETVKILILDIFIHFEVITP